MRRHRASLPKTLAIAAVTIMLASMRPPCLLAQSVLEMEEGAPVSIGTIRKIQSTALGDERTLLVSLPQKYEGTAARYPVLYLLYGDQVEGYFAETVHHVRRLAGMGAIPQMIVVGVANVERYRDLRPVAARGGASRIEQFIEFVSAEMFPFVEREYRTKAFRVLVGPQAGAVFGLYVLTGGRALFDAYILGNPFEARDCADILTARSEAIFAADLPGYTFLQITCVTKTPALDLAEAVGIARGFKETVSRLAPKNLDLGMIYIDDNEDFVPSPNQKAGLKRLFADYTFPAERTVERLGDFISHYDDLSTRLGFDIGYPEQPLVLRAVDLAAAGKTDAAAEILDFVLEDNPLSLNACWQLANLRRSLGDRAAAIGLYRRCLELMPNMTPAREWLNRLEAQD